MEEEKTLSEANQAPLNELDSNCKIKTNGLTMIADQNNLPDNNNEDDDDDLEEGELKDDDDDDDEDEEIGNDAQNKSETGRKSKASDEDSIQRPASSSSSTSSSSSSSDPKEQNSSRSSSKLGSHHSSSSKKHDKNTSYDFKNKRFKLSSQPANQRGHTGDDKYRTNWEKEDTTEKAAKLISMRTKLLEARSREIEMKFQKHRGVISKTSIKSSTPPISTTLPAPTITAQPLEDNVKMTIAKPSISYSENPNPPSATSEAIEAYTSAKRKLRSKNFKSEEQKEKKTKKRIKKRKKSSKSVKKHKKRRSESSSTKKLNTDSRMDTNSQDLELLPYDNLVANDHQGPRTPPDNQILTINDEQIEWPSHLIRMTITQPSISYSVNPNSVIDYQKYSLSSNAKTSIIYDVDFNSDYNWYYDYFLNTYEMDSNQAQHQAYFAMLSAGNYEQKTLQKWFISRGFEIVLEEQEQISQEQVEKTTTATTTLAAETLTNTAEKDLNTKEELNEKKEESEVKMELKEVVIENKETNELEVDKNGELEPKQEADEGTITKRSIKPIITMVKCHKEIVLPNGQVLPAGTLQKVVHPYPKLKSELLGPYFDMY